MALIDGWIGNDRDPIRNNLAAMAHPLGEPRGFEVVGFDGPVDPPAAHAERAKALIGLAGICYWQSDLDAAEHAYGTARELAKHAGDWWLELEALLGLVSTIACHRGDLDQARPYEEQFRALIAEHPDPFAIGFGLATSQLMRLLTGDLDGSRQYGEQLLVACRQMGQRWYEGQTLRTLGYTSLRQGELDRAESELRQSLLIAADMQDLTGAAIDLDRLGILAMERGQAAHAVILAAAAAGLREAAGGGLPVETFRWEVEHPTDAARRLLPEAEIEQAWARGRAMNLAEAATYSAR